MPPPDGVLLETAALDDLFADAPVGLGVVDRDLRYRRVNEALARMNGRPVEEHLGRSIREVLPATADVIEPLLRQVLGGEPIVDLEVPGPGQERSFRVTYLPVRQEDGEVGGVAALVVDTTDRRRAEAALRVTEERLQLALEGTRTGTWDWDFASGQIHWSENLGPLLGLPRGTRPSGLDEFLARVHPEDREPLLAALDAARAGEPFSHEFRTVWPEGTIRWLHSRGHVVRDDAGRAVSIVGLLDDISERRDRELATGFLARASAALAESLDVRATLQHVSDLAVPELAEWCVVALKGEHGLETVAVGHEDPAQRSVVWELQERYPPAQDAPVGAPAVVRTGRSQLFGEVSDDLLESASQDVEHLELLRALGLSSGMVVPITARGRTLGAITFASTRPGRRYDEGDLALAEELGHRAAIALDNAQLHALETASRQRLQALQTVIEAGLEPLGVQDLLAELLRRIRTVTGGDFAVFLLRDEEGDDLRVEAALGLDAEQGQRMPAGRGIQGEVLRTGRPVSVENASDVEIAVPSMRDAGAVVAVPLRAGGQVLGVLELGTRAAGGLGPAAVELLELVAERAARAIAHARLYEQAHDTALTLQRSLLPAALAAVEGVTSAARYVPGQAGLEVGGDWYDLFPLHGGCHAVVVGDVVGRGLRAAATMGQLRAATRAYAHQAQDPARALMLLDDMVSALGEVTFATLALVALDPAARKATICSAGHPPPLVVTEDGARLLDVPVGPPIGAPPGERRTTTVQLEECATVALYTDGLVETREQPIDERFAQLCRVAADGPAAPEALLDRLLEGMIGGRDHHDDAALVAVQLT